MTAARSLAWPVVVFALSACAPTLSRSGSDAFDEALARASLAHTEQREHDEREALAEAASVARRRVDREEAQYREAMLLSRIGDVARAVELLDGIAAARPALRRTHRARLEAAKLRIARGDAEVAHRELEALVAEAPEHGSSSTALRLLLRARSRDASTLAWLDELYARGAGRGQVGDDVLFERATLFVELGDATSAERELERLIEAHPYPFGERFDDACWMLADLAEARGDARAEVAALVRLLSVWEPSAFAGSYSLPKMSAAAFRLGGVYRDRLGDARLAEEAFARVVRDFGDSLYVDDALSAIAELAFVRGDVREGCAALEHVVSLNASDASREAAEAKRREHCVPPPSVSR